MAAEGTQDVLVKDGRRDVIIMVLTNDTKEVGNQDSARVGRDETE